jgi:hypothetical protein
MSHIVFTYGSRYFWRQANDNSKTKLYDLVMRNMPICTYFVYGFFMEIPKLHQLNVFNGRSIPQTGGKLRIHADVDSRCNVQNEEEILNAVNVDP